MADDGNLLYLVPTRGRPSKAVDLIQSWQDTIELPDTHLMLILDSDDPEFRMYESAIEMAAKGPARFWLEMWALETYQNPPNARLTEALNRVCSGILSPSSPQPFAIGFMGDDHRPRTKGWDRRILEKLQELGTGIVYGNDLVHGEYLPTAVAMTTDIPRALGFMAPPALKHMYLDNFWKDLGRSLARLRYLAEVTIEHAHPIAGKTAWDEGYRTVAAHMQKDEVAYLRYMARDFGADVEKVKAVMQ